jgi:hypothetical protein
MGAFPASTPASYLSASPGNPCAAIASGLLFS